MIDNIVSKYVQAEVRNASIRDWLSDLPTGLTFEEGIKLLQDRYPIKETFTIDVSELRRLALGVGRPPEVIGAR